MEKMNKYQQIGRRHDVAMIISYQMTLLFFSKAHSYWAQENFDNGFVNLKSHAHFCGQSKYEETMSLLQKSMPRGLGLVPNGIYFIVPCYFLVAIKYISSNGKATLG